MPKDTDKTIFGPVRLGPIWYIVLGLFTGPGAYAFKTGNTLALVGFAALCGLWYVAGRTGLLLIQHRIALAAVVDVATTLAIEAKASRARLSSPADKAIP